MIGGIILKFNKETNYAIIMTLFCVKSKPDLLSSTNIVNECKVPENLGKIILTKLTNSNILESLKGKNGGIRYNHPNKTISLFDIIEVFEKIEICSCIDNFNSCSYRKGRCIISDEMRSIRNVFIQHFENIFVEDIIDKQLQKYNN